MEKKYQIAFIGALLLLSVALIVMSAGYPERARTLPLVIIGLVMLLLVRELIKVVKGKAQASKIKGSQLKLMLSFAWIVGLTVLTWLLGFVIALPLFTFVYIKTQGERWLWAFVLSLGMLVLVYVGFGLLLRLPLYEGLLFGG